MRMKERAGFVSNSSSSSFIVVYDDAYDVDSMFKKFKNYYERYVTDDNEFVYTPTFEFGWQQEDYNAMSIKFDWVMLTWGYMGFQEAHKEMIERLLRNAFGRGIYLMKYNMDGICGYIDHQSIDDIVFSSYSYMEDFILCSHSYIHNDNDNN